MLKEEARRAVIAEWRGLPKEQRQTETDALLFAMKAKERYRWRASGDPYQHIMGWIRPYIGQP